MMRWVLAGVVVVALLLGVAAVGAGALIDSGAVRGRLAEAVQRATGHALRLDGPIRLAWSLAPAIEVRDAALLNPAGFSRPDFARAGRLEARVRLLPLLTGRVAFAAIALEGVDVLLERDAAGRGNWQAPVAPDAPAAPGGERQERRPAEVERVVLDDARIVWLRGPVVVVTHLSAAPGGGALEGALTVNGVPMALTGEAVAGGAMRAALVGGGLALSVSGAAGAAMEFEARAADLAALQPLVGRPLAPLREVRLTGQVAGGVVSALHLVAGSSELGGVRLASLEVAAPGMEQAVKLTVAGQVRGLAFTGAVQVPALSGLLRPGPFPFQAQLAADGGTLAAQGTAEMVGRVEAAVSARVPDLRRSAGLAGVALPALTEVALEVRLAPMPTGSGVLARGLRVMSRQGDLAGDLAVGFAPRVSVRGTLVSQRLDFDAVAPEPVAVAAPAGPAPVAAEPVGGAKAFPFERLRQGDADLRVTVGQVVLHGAEYRALEARLLLQDGRLRVDPARMQAPGGLIQGQVLADAGDQSAAVKLFAQGLDAATVATAAGAADAVTGTADIDVDLRGQGADWRAMAATLEGHAGLALVDGDVENAALMALFGPALRAANLPIDPAGRSRVRCFGTRVDAAAGQVSVRALALDASRLRLDGDGTVNLREQTVDLHLRPTLRIGGTGIAIPVRLTGPIGAPKTAMERGAIAPGRVGISIGGAPAADPCGPALAAARDGRPGVLPR